jgi:uncharacterized protein
VLSFLTTPFLTAARPLRTASRPVTTAVRSATDRGAQRVAGSRARTSPRRTKRQARTLQLVGGLVTVGVGVALLIQADLGVASWDVLHVALARRSGASVGTVALLVGLLAFGLAALLRERPRPGSLVPLLLVAPTIDVALRTIPAPATAAGQVAMLATGLVVLAAGIGAYVTSDHGAGPGDLVFLALAKRGLSLGTARLLVDGAAVAVGWALGGPVGIGTVLVTACLGPLVATTIRVFDLAPARATVGRLDREFDRAQALELHHELEGV